MKGDAVMRRFTRVYAKMMQIKVFLPTLVMLFVFVNGNTAAASQTFNDVPDGFWAKAEIEYLTDQGIVNGYPNGKFGVNDRITRLQAASMMIRALGLETNNRTQPDLLDVSPDYEGYDTIATIVDTGIMRGNENKEFRPNDFLTRGQMASILVQAFDLKGDTSYAFRDVSNSHWASQSIRTLFANNITIGYANNTFQPDATISRAQFAVFVARVLNPDFKTMISCYKPNNNNKYIVNVAATTLWQQPNIHRSMDQLSLSNPVDLESWTKRMNLTQKLWLGGKIDTQALYGQEVSILQSKGDWYQIAVMDQSTPKNKNGYPGWVPKSHISEYYPNYENCQVAIVDMKTTNLYQDTAFTSQFTKISFNTRLPVLKVGSDWVQVHTPTGENQYIRKQDVNIYSSEKEVPKPSQNDLVQTAKKFIGLPYLWAGISGFGFDCSGFTHTIYKRHGILIPRDSSNQIKQGTAISKSNMQPGDLMFFAYNNGKGRVHHVSMYIGNGQMIHSPNSEKSVEIISMNTEPYKSEFAGARRYLK